jgi:hypothetical protein
MDSQDVQESGIQVYKQDFGGRRGDITRTSELLKTKLQSFRLRMVQNDGN